MKLSLKESTLKVIILAYKKLIMKQQIALQISFYNKQIITLGDLVLLMQMILIVINYLHNLG